MEVSAFLAGFVIFLSDALILWLLIRLLLGQLQPVVQDKMVAAEPSPVPVWVRVFLTGTLLLAKTFFLLFSTWIFLDQLGFAAGSFAGGAVMALLVFIPLFFLKHRK